MSGHEDMTTSELREALVRILGRLINNIDNMSREEVISSINALQNNSSLHESASAMQQFEDVSRVVLGSLAAFQIGAALHGIWQSWANRNPNPTVPTEYERAVNRGETIRGWKLVIPMAGLNTSQMIKYGLVKQHIVAFEDEEMPAPDSGSTITLHVTHPLPCGQRVFSVRQYEPFQTDEKILFNICYDPVFWRHAFSSYVSTRSILVVFQHHETEIKCQRIVLFDTYQGHARSFSVLTPADHVRIAHAYTTQLPKPKLHVIYVANVFNLNQEVLVSNIEILDCAYDVQVSESQLERWPSSSISIPVGTRTGCYRINTEHGIVLVAIDNARPDDTDAHLCISFDRTKTWRVETMTEWLQSFRASSYGKSMLEAARDFASLSPPSQWRLIEIPGCPVLRYFDRMVTNGNGTHVLGFTDNEGILRRWISLPPLKRIAIEAMFKIKPNLTRSDIEKLFGPALASHIFGEEKKRNGNVTLQL